MHAPIFKCAHFNELSTEDWYSATQLRIAVFIIEQTCIYQDLDGKDLQCYHLLGSTDNSLVAYARIVPPGISYAAYASIGRVVTHPKYRKYGFGKLLMSQAIQHCKELFPDYPIKISAQSYLISFYKEFGFKPVGEEYLEDDIPHHAMIST